MTHVKVVYAKSYEELEKVINESIKGQQRGMGAQIIPADIKYNCDYVRILHENTSNERIEKHLSALLFYK